MLCEEKSNHIEKIQFSRLSINIYLRETIFLTREIECQEYFFSSNGVFNLGTEVLNDILNKCKSHEDKRNLNYINEIETPTNRDAIFVKGKKETPNQVGSPSPSPLCTYY